MEKNVNKRYACLLNGRGSPRYGPLLNHDQPKAHFSQESSGMRWLASSPRLLRLCSKGTNQSRILTLRYGGPGHPDPVIGGGGLPSGPSLV